MLTRLPEVLSIDILSEWCDLKIVAKVNSAFCSTDSTYSNTKSFWEWIVMNEMKLIRVKGMWCAGTDDAFVHKVNFSKVNEFYVNRLKKVRFLVMLINKSIDLKLLDISASNSYTDNALNELLSLISNQILSGVTDLTISDEYRKHAHGTLNLSRIHIACTQLRSLRLLREYRCGFHENAIIQIVRNNKYLQNFTLHGCVCKTVLMTAISMNCLDLRSLTISDIQINSNECSLLTSCKQLTDCVLT
jgi:hypothetical protein